MNIIIDKFSGFCHGVLKTVEITEDILKKNTDFPVYVIGEIIHNPLEIARLDEQGLKTISVNDLDEISKNEPNAIIIIRAHGEPPNTYKKIENLNLKLIDATCSRVRSLQHQVEKYYQAGEQIIIYGKSQHPEVIGLMGFCDGNCDVIQSEAEAENIDLIGDNVVLISQTTMNKNQLHKIAKIIEDKTIDLNQKGRNIKFKFIDSTCKAVTKRESSLIDFAKNVDCVLFISGKNSSNGKSLYHIALSANPNTIFIETQKEIDYNYLKQYSSIGITGATSTPYWYLENIKSVLEETFNK